MSAAIKSSLINLNESINRLEESAKAAKSAAKQAKDAPADLFSAVTSGKEPSNANGKAVDSKAFARRLDSAIDRVERLLKEGRG